MYDNSRLRREIGQYIAELKEQGMSKKHIGATRSVLLRFSEHCAKSGIRSSKSVTRESLMTFLESFERFSAGYQLQARTYLRRFLAEHDNPAMLRIRSTVTGSARTRVDWLTPEETVAVLHSPMSQQQSVLIGAGLLEGMRRIETLRMTVKDARNALRFSVLRVHGKGGKERPIPLDQDFATILKNYLTWAEPKNEETPLLGFGVTKSEVLLDDFCDHFGRRFTYHTMRRTFGRNLWLTKTPIETISEFLGHSSSDMTRKYLGLNLTDMRQALTRYTVSRECTLAKTLD